MATAHRVKDEQTEATTQRDSQIHTGTGYNLQKKR